MAFTLAALKTEINTDPLSLGYAPLRVAPVQPQGVANLLNALTGAGVASIFRNDVRVGEIMAVIAAADFTSMTQLQTSKLQLLFMTGTLDATVPSIRTNFANQVPNAGGSQTAAAAVASRTGSRAEVLWGCGTIISSDQVIAALNS